MYVSVSQVNGYPSSPFDTTPLVFKKPYRHLVTLEDSIKTTKGEMPCDEVRNRRECCHSQPCHINCPADAVQGRISHFGIACWLAVSEANGWLLQNNRCMKGFNINIAQTWYDFGLAEDTQCKKIPVLSYNDVGVPGPLMISET